MSENEKIVADEKSNTGDLASSVELELLDDGSIADTKHRYNDESIQLVKVLISNAELPSLVFKENQVYKFENNKLGPLLGQFSNPELSFIRHVVAVNNKYILVSGDSADSNYVDTYLWQVDVTTLEKVKIAGDLYYSFIRPPKIFISKDNNEIAVIYYTGSRNYAFGGNSSRPKLSVIRIYNSKFPEGKDIVNFSFKAGTIIDITWKNDGLILVGDPTPPRTHQLAAKVWHVKY